MANRSLERAQELASQFGGFALPLSELEGTLPDADILISSTASPDAVITHLQMEAAIRATQAQADVRCRYRGPARYRSRCCGELDDVYLYTIDDLDKVVMEGQGSREAAAVDANKILNEEIVRYLSMQRAKEVAPLITSLREKADALRDDVLRQARRRLAQGADGDEVLEYATAALMKKLLHNPSVRLREAGENSDEEIIAAARAVVRHRREVSPGA